MANGGVMGAFSTQNHNNNTINRRRYQTDTDDFDRYENEGINDAELDLLQSQPDYNLEHHITYNQTNFANEQAENNPPPPPQWSDNDL
jgi:hypothetical protein